MNEKRLLKLYNELCLKLEASMKSGHIKSLIREHIDPGEDPEIVRTLEEMLPMESIVKASSKEVPSDSKQ